MPHDYRELQIQYIGRKVIMKGVACMPNMITRKGQRHARAIHRKWHKRIEGRKREVARDYAKCAPPEETKRE